MRCRLVGSFYVNYVDPKLAQSIGYEALNCLFVSVPVIAVHKLCQVNVKRGVTLTWSQFETINEAWGAPATCMQPAASRHINIYIYIFMHMTIFNTAST